MFKRFTQWFDALCHGLADDLILLGRANAARNKVLRGPLK